jgi:hypothetical protein
MTCSSENAQEKGYPFSTRQLASPCAHLYSGRLPTIGVMHHIPMHLQGDQGGAEFEYPLYDSQETIYDGRDI